MADHHAELPDGDRLATGGGGTPGAPGPAGAGRAEPEPAGAGRAEPQPAAGTAGPEPTGPTEPLPGTIGEPAAPTRARRSDRRRARAERKRHGSFLRELPVLLLIAFVLAFLLRTFVLQVFYIPSASMEPTLMVDDRMVVEKVTYRFREPLRGEIVVFEGETTGNLNGDEGAVGAVIRGVGQFLGVVPANARDFVKRVIGLPGDEVFIEDGLVYVNGQQLTESYIQPEHDDYGPIIVPEDRLFFLGDNRANSSDSRRSLGFVPRDQVVGRAVVVIWPPAHTGLLTGVEHDVPAGDPSPPTEDELPATEPASTG